MQLVLGWGSRWGTMTRTRTWIFSSRTSGITSCSTTCLRCLQAIAPIATLKDGALATTSYCEMMVLWKTMRRA